MTSQKANSHPSIIRALKRRYRFGGTLIVRALDEGVRVPSGAAYWTLSFGAQFGRDLEVDNEGISQTLYFSGQPFNCFVPWSAVSPKLRLIVGGRDVAKPPASASPLPA